MNLWDAAQKRRGPLATKLSKPRLAFLCHRYIDFTVADFYSTLSLLSTLKTPGIWLARIPATSLSVLVSTDP
jgi:hypothetical protein